jgi:hypothetical protein
VLFALPFVGACGGASPESTLELSPLPSTTTTAPLVTTPVGPATTVPGAPTTTPVAQKWTEVTGNLAGLTSDCGNVSVAARAGEDMMISFVNTHGLYSTTAASDQWTPLGTGGGDPVTNRMNQILADPDPANSQTFWEAGNYGPGVYRTDDNGATFTALGDVEHVDYLSIDFADPERSTMLAGGHESSIVHLSRDAGRTWDQVPGLPADVGFTSSPYVIDANTFLVASYQGAGAGVYRSTDGGDTWTQVYDGPVIGPAIATEGKLRWLLYEGAGVITSTDGGVTWTAKSGGAVVARSATRLVALPDGSIATWADSFVVVSTDDGATWRRFGPATPYTPMGLAYSSTGTFFVFRYECDFNTDNAVDPDSILRLDPA